MKNSVDWIDNTEEIDFQTNELDIWNATQITMHRVYLNFKAMVNEFYTLALILLLPTIICLSTISFIVLKYSLGPLITSSIMIVEIITYGTIAGSFRRSTLNKNSNLTIGVRWIDNLATLITMILISIIVLCYVLALLTLFDLIGIMIVDASGSRSSSFDYLLLSAVNIPMIFYQSILVGIISYSFSYFFQGFFDSDMMFVTLGVLLFISIIIFGATMNNYFRLDDIMDPRNSGIDTYIKYNPDIMGNGLFIPSLFTPFYVPCQVMRVASQQMTRPEINNAIVWSWQSSSNGVIGSNAWKWNILWFVPYFHILFWWIVGFMYKNIWR